MSRFTTENTESTEGDRGIAIFGRRWTRREYATDAVTLGRRLLGRMLVRVLDDGTLLAARIVETEAYCGVIDAASHAYRGRRTARNEVMYAGPGTAYVYFTYGMHYCMNIVCGDVHVPLAVLIRAAEPIAGIEAMRQLRAVHPGKNSRRMTELPDRALCSGPARLCQAFGIGRAQNGIDLVEGPSLYIAEPHPRAGLAPIRPRDISRTPRIGIDYAGAWAAKPLRFVVTNSEHLSKPLKRAAGNLAKPGKVRDRAPGAENRVARSRRRPSRNR